jgi:cbb3-type cytochrome oxidase subunit 3
MSIHIANPKSFVAGSLVLVMAVKTILQSSHVVALHTFNLVLLPVVSILCIWHAFMGRRPLLGRSEIHTSVFLGVLSLLMAGGFTLLGLSYRHQSLQFLFALLFYAAAAFYFREALQERRSSEAQNHS